MARPRSWTLEAVNPRGDQSDSMWEVRLDQAHVDGLTRYGIGPRLYRLQLVPQVLGHPIVVFEGLKRDGQEKSICYVGRPRNDYRSELIEVPAPKGMVFLVFVTNCGKIFDWRWERADANNPDYPEHYSTRFTRVLWPETQTL